MTDYIEGAEVEVDLDENDKPCAYLHLNGDFEDTFRRYLSNDFNTAVVIKLPRDAAEKLHHDLTEVLYG